MNIEHVSSLKLELEKIIPLLCDDGGKKILKIYLILYSMYAGETICL